MAASRPGAPVAVTPHQMKRFKPLSVSEEIPEVMAPAVLREGDVLLPGELQQFDILCLPKRFAEVVQVLKITGGGTPEEAYECKVLPGDATSKKVAEPWSLTLAQLNGPKDQTGEQRPVAVLRLGRAISAKPRTVLVVSDSGTREFVVVNRGGAKTYSLALPGIPLNARLRTLADVLPAE